MESRILATITNRSRYVVSTKNRADLTREFPFSDALRAQQYLKELRDQGFKPTLSQREDTLLVRIRKKGFPEQTFTTSSYEEAETAIGRIESDRQQGLFIDYTRAHKITFAELFERYIKEVCPRHKGKDVETYTLRGFIVDSKGELAALLQEREALEKAGATALPIIRAHREPRYAVEWVQKPFAQVLPTDIEQYIHARLDQEIKPATIDRELDLIAQVVSWARKTLRIHLYQSPLYGVERPKYFNERDRRLKGNEEHELMKAAREEDRLQARERAIRAHMAPARAEAMGIPQQSARKRYLERARREAEAAIGDDFPVVPWFEALITFLLETAARRSEALSLLRKHTHLDEMSAYLPETKNGLSRSLPLRENVILMLRKLPRTHDRVFPISVFALKKAWYRICERAGLMEKVTYKGREVERVSFHIHDLRHEAISRITEAGYASGRPFDVVTLASITGHRDLRMLARYTRLCTGEIARRLDEAFELAKQKKQWRKGRVVTSTPTRDSESQLATSQRGTSRPPEAPVQQADHALSAPDSSKPANNVLQFKRRTY
jgi:integrase